MFNEQRLKTIHGKIQASTLLSDHEKSDWLNLLELMNDKQLSDLENILTPPLASPTAFTPSSVPSKPLSHIANLPAGIADRKAEGVTHQELRAVPAKSNKWLDDMKLVMSEKELPAGHAIPKASGITKLPAEKVVKDTPVRTVKEIEIEEDSDPRAPLTWEPKTASDCSLLSVAIYRNMGAAKITQVLQQLVKTQGYAHVLHNLQQSKLYKTYVATGHNLLAAGPGEVKSVISKKEFEEIVDILRGIQVN
jgi:hypothetical protein